MSSGTHQTARSLFQSLYSSTSRGSPSALARKSALPGFVCSQCRSRSSAAWSRSVTGTRSAATVLGRQQQQFNRQWSSSAVHKSDKPPRWGSDEPIPMPAPPSATSEKASSTASGTETSLPPSSFSGKPPPSTSPISPPPTRPRIEDLEEEHPFLSPVDSRRLHQWEALLEKLESGRSESAAKEQEAKAQKAAPTKPPPPPPPPPGSEPPQNPTPGSESTKTAPPTPEPKPTPEAPKPDARDAEDMTQKKNREALPSDTEKQRWQLSKRTQLFMDDFLAKAAIFSQQLNTYTGTDYSGVERLRREIIEQEQLVKACHARVAAAKEAHTSTYVAQAASQKEVVGLLERKHSWSAADLERYMALIRSEHLNEQAVQRAKDHLSTTERELEDARALLERKERKQYHEEQIWSDTIRRNSTWVTFGLMGVNILLLLANLVIFEPYRRRKIVREIKAALEESKAASFAAVGAVPAATVAAEAAAAAAPAPGPVVEVVPSVEATQLEEQIDSAVEPVDLSLEELDGSASAAPGEVALATGEVLPEEAIPVEASAAPSHAQKSARDMAQKVEKAWKQTQAKVQDLFSERPVTLKQVDVTAIALEGAAAGVAVMGLVLVLLQAR